MIVYRVGKTKYARNLTGDGAQLNGGRWNHKEIPCFYTSQSRALAVLEYSVNVNIDDIPRALSITMLEIPDGVMLEVAETHLPGNWKEVLSPASTRDFGTHLLQTTTLPVLRIPSSVIPEEFNFLLSPLHPDSRDCRVVDVRDFI